MAPFLVSFRSIPIFGFEWFLLMEDHIFWKADLESSSFFTKLKLYFFALGWSFMLDRKVTKSTKPYFFFQKYRWWFRIGWKKEECQLSYSLPKTNSW